ncbi:MAG: cadmium-translocating P-type ATPase [Chlamydiia bacterium]|nr:cadmium-translocating P-type ATPase [Chlamydiia bacterium]
MRLTFKVAGLDCAEEIAILKKALAKRKGIVDLEFDVLNAKMVVTCENVTSDQIIQWVKEGGMKAVPWKDKGQLEEGTFWSRYGRLLTTMISGGFLVIAVFFHLHQNPISHRFYFLAMAFGAYFVLPKAWHALKRLQPDMNLLMIIAIAGAIAIHEWFEGATVAFLFSVALLLEHWSVGKARKAVAALMDLSPTIAHVIDRGDLRVEEVQVGERLLIRPGEKIPLDGVVEKGSTSIDQSPITGESMPVQKKEGDDVFAGTLNGEGAFECRVTKGANDTTLARIIHLVEEAQSRRAGAQQWVEKFAKIYTPIMICIALLVAIIPPLLVDSLWNVWLYRALVILVIACPCALVISTPVSIVSGMTKAARQGVLIKGGMFLEMPYRLKALALDKTGTLTYGHPEVQEVIPLSGHTEEELLMRAAALEAPSEHPIARAILNYAKKKGVTIKRAENFQVTQGKGAEGTFEGDRYWIGSHRFMHEMKQETPEIHEKALKLEDAGHSIIAIGNSHHVCGLISVADQPRADAHRVIQEIKDEGVEQVVMLTGDNKPAAQAIARLTGVDEAYAELLPADKVAAIERLKEKWGTIAMVGDGINDAPAMATASFGIAMGAMGTDAAIETSDIVLMSDELSRVPWLIRHSKRTVRIIQQNIAFSLAIKAIFLTLAILGLASLWMAIAADTGAALIVVFNGLRLLK